MDQVLEEEQFPFQPADRKAFKRMVVLSVLLHIIVFACLINNKYNSIGGNPVAFIDLTISNPVSAPAGIARHASKVKPPVQPLRAPDSSPAVTDTSELNNLQKMIENNLQADQGTTDINKVSLAMGATRGYFRSLGQGETLRDDIQSYYFEILQSINEQWWIDKSIDRKGVRELVMNLVISRDGTIVDKQLVYTSGNREYDGAVLKAIELVGRLSPLPQSYHGDFFIAPIRLVAPLNLLAS